MQIKILPFGTCRLYRSFLKKENRVLHDNRDEYTQIAYPKLGFFHSIHEIEQVLRLISKGLATNLCNYQKYIFRQEPIATTPENEFDRELAFSIHENILGRIDSKLLDVDVVLIEISSLDYFYHADSKLIFHTNPNFEINATYADIYPDGFYLKYKSELGVDKMTSSADEVILKMMEIKALLQDKPVIVIGHLYNPENPNHIRSYLCKVLSDACMVVGFVFFDTSRYVSDYGFRVDDAGKIDIHHLSHEGEMALGSRLQILAKEVYLMQKNKNNTANKAIGGNP
jgi:hypothetical protein